jgi:protein-disulfide isomerase
MHTRFSGLLLVIPLLVALAATPVAAQSRDELAKMRKDIEALEESHRALQKDLEDVKALLRARLAPPATAGPQAALAQPVTLTIDGAPFRGRKDARVTLVEFSDFQCAFCARHSRQTLPAIVKDYVDAGTVRYVLRDFPIAALHPGADKAHEAAHCAGEQGKYWDMHPLLFANIRGQDRAGLTAYARTLKLDAGKFEQCLTAGRHAPTIKKAIEEGQRAGVRGTPTFFVGVTGNGRTLQATQMLRGAQPYETFKAAIETVLAGLRQPR